MAGFVEVQFTQEASQMATEALERLAVFMEATGYAGWKVQAAALETILTETLAPIGEDVAQVAAVVPPAIFRRYGTKLLQLPYNEGAAATGTATFTLSPDSEGKYPARKIPVGLQVTQGNFAFYVETEVSVAEGHSTATVQVVAALQGTEYNGITGVLEAVESIDWLKEITLVGETTGGAAQEEDSEYQDRLQSELQLQAPRPITASDYAAFVLGMPSTILPSGVVVGRTTAIDGYNAESNTENVERCVTTFVADPEGKALSKPHMEAIETWVRGYREMNFLAFIEEPSYTKIFITAKVHVLTAYSPEAVVANIKSALESLLSTRTWGNPTAATTGVNQWINEKPSKVRYNVILGTIENVPGVAYVFPGSEGLKIGITASPTETADITLPGPAPLPETEAADLIIAAA